MVRWVRDQIDMELLRIGEAPSTTGAILVAVILAGTALWVGGWSQQVGYRLAYRRIRDRGLRQALATFTRYVVIVVGLLLALKIIGFDLTAITVFATSLGVGIGFGLQNIVNNFISGILLLAERPLRVGDYVTIGPHEGNVTQLLEDPPSGIYLWEHNEEGVRIRIQFCFRFVQGPGSFATRSAVLAEIGRRFQANGIAFAEVRLLPALVVPEGAQAP
jgi:hypothetical protein